MASRASATLHLVTHNDAQPTFLTVHLQGHTELAGECERVPHPDSQALALCAGDRDLPTLRPRSATCSADQ